jgi:predicted O-methyltransferase YrrM
MQGLAMFSRPQGIFSGDALVRATKSILRQGPVRIVRNARRDARTDGLVRRLRWGARLPAADRRLFARIAAEMEARCDRQTLSHARLSSSDFAALRLLSDLAEAQRPRDILEIGTGYGFSTIALARCSSLPRVTTIEFSLERHRLARANLSSAGLDGVHCMHADKIDALRELTEAGAAFDMVFHDGGHSGDEYVRDFARLLPLLRPGALIVFDDIAWDRSERMRAQTRAKSARSCIEGWQAVAESPHTAWAVTINRRVGVVRLA